MSELKIEKHFKASPEKVFAFVTQTEHLLKWWGPVGITITEHNLSLSDLGAWSSVMKGSEGNTYKVTGEVLAIDPPNSVDFSWAWHDENDVRGHESSVRFEVKSDGNGGTLFTMIHSNLPDDETAQKHNQGWSSSFTKLEKLAA